MKFMLRRIEISGTLRALDKEWNCLKFMCNLAINISVGLYVCIQFKLFVDEKGIQFFSTTWILKYHRFFRYTIYTLVWNFHLLVFFFVVLRVFFQPSFRVVFVINCAHWANKRMQWMNKQNKIASKKKFFAVVDKIMTIMESIAILVDVTLWYWPFIGTFFSSIFTHYVCIRTQVCAQIKIFQKYRKEEKNTLTIQIFFSRKFPTTRDGVLVFKKNKKEWKTEYP